MNTGALVGEIATGLLLQIGFTMALSAWGRWAARRRGGGRFWAWAPWAPWISFALLSAGLAVSIPMLLGAFHDVSRLDPASRARTLSEGIRRAMLAGAFFFSSGYLVLVSFVIAAGIASLRAPRAAPSRKE